MSSPASYEDPEERERRICELSSRLVDENRVEPETVGQKKREYANNKHDLTRDFLRFTKISEDYEMDHAILEAIIYRDIAEEIYGALKKFDNIL